MSSKANVGTNTQSAYGLPAFAGTNVQVTGQQSQSAQQDAYASQVYIDPEILKTQKNQSISMLDSQIAIAKDRCKAEFEAQKQAIVMKAEHDMAMANASIEQSKVQALFTLDQQFQQRRMEIEQRAQEQKLQIEATASQLLMTAEQQRLEKEMAEKMAKVYGSLPPQSLMQGGGFIVGQPGSNAFGPATGSQPSLPMFYPQFAYITPHNQSSQAAETVSKRK